MLAVFSNLVLGDDPDAGRFTMLSATIGYAQDWRRFTIDAAFEGIIFPHWPQYSRTGELQVNVSLSLGARFSVVAQQTVDVISHPGAYLGAAGLLYAPELREDLDLELSTYAGFGSSGFNAAYFDVATTAWNDVTARAAVTWSPVGALYTQPHLDFVRLMDTQLRRASVHPTDLVVGLAVGVSVDGRHVRRTRVSDRR